MCYNVHMVSKERKLVVAYDGDGVCFDSAGAMIKGVSEYCSENGISDAQKIRILPKIVKGVRDDDTRQLYDSGLVSEISKNIPVMPGCIETLEFLRNYVLNNLVTRRGDDLYPNAEVSTKEYVVKHGFPFNSTHFGVEDKAEFCKKNGIWLLVDDSIKTCEKTLAVGVLAIVFNTDFNRSTPTDCPRAEDWVELRELIMSALKSVRQSC